MTSDSILISDGKTLRFTYGKYTLTHFPSGEEADGDTGFRRGTILVTESSENCTSLKVAYDLTPSSMNLSILGLNGCGQEERLLLEKMRSVIRQCLTNSLETLFENLEK